MRAVRPALPQAARWRRRRWRRPCPAAAEHPGVRVAAAAALCCGCSRRGCETRERAGRGRGLRGTERSGALQGLPEGSPLRRGGGAALQPGRGRGAVGACPGWGHPQSPSRAAAHPWPGEKGSGGSESRPRLQRWPCGAAGCTPCTRARSCPRRTRCCGRRSGTSRRRS